MSLFDFDFFVGSDNSFHDLNSGIQPANPPDHVVSDTGHSLQNRRPIPTHFERKIITFFKIKTDFLNYSKFFAYI